MNTTASKRVISPRPAPRTSRSSGSGLPLDVIEREFDRVQSLFPRIDAKLSAVFAIVSGEMALASLGISGDNWRSWDILVPAGLFLSVIGFSLYNLYRCTFPHVKKSGTSLVYFAEIARLSEASVLRAFSEATEEQFKEDLVRQTWLTSQIATQKFYYLKLATTAAMVSLGPWAWLLAASSWSAA